MHYYHQQNTECYIIRSRVRRERVSTMHRDSMVSETQIQPYLLSLCTYPSLWLSFDTSKEVKCSHFMKSCLYTGDNLS